ncbi:MAG: acylphosphatase, partial [Phycisphaerae bacterium]
DGRVELVAEGEPRQVESFIQAVRDEMAAYVQALELSSRPATPEFSDFGISYV